MRQVYGRSPTDDLNAALYGVYSWTTHFKPQFILVETIWRIHDLPRINSCSLWNSCSNWLKSWSRIRKKLTVWPRLISKNQREDRRLYYVTKLLRLRMPKPLTSPTRCSVWEASVTNHSKLGRTKVCGFWKTLSQRSESNRRGADGIRVDNVTMIHNIGHSRRGSQILWQHYRVEPEQFRNRIIFMSMFNDIVWREQCETNSVKVVKYARRFPLGRLFLGPGSEKKWYGIDSYQPKRNWDKIANANSFNVADYAPKFPQRRWSFFGFGCE